MSYKFVQTPDGCCLVNVPPEQVVSLRDLVPQTPNQDLSKWTGVQAGHVAAIFDERRQLAFTGPHLFIVSDPMTGEMGLMANWNCAPEA